MKPLGSLTIFSRALIIILLPVAAAAQVVNCTPPPGGWTQANRIPAGCYLYPLANSMWANRVPVDAMQHLWKPSNYGLGTTYSSDQYARALFDAEGNVAVNCSAFAAAQGGAQPSSCGGTMGGYLGLSSPASDGTRSNQDGFVPIYFADASMPVYSIGTVSGGVCSGTPEAPHVCAVFHAPSGAQWTWFGGGYCFTSSAAGAAGNSQNCEYTSQCPSNFPVCEASSSRTSLQPAGDDSFLDVLDQAQGLAVSAYHNVQTPPASLAKCSGGPGTCASVCGGHAGTLTDPCPITGLSYAAAERYGTDKDWGWNQVSQDYTTTINGAQEFLGAEGDNGAGMVVDGSTKVRLEEFIKGIFHVTQGGAGSCNSTVPTIWPATTPCNLSTRTTQYPPGGSWFFLDYTDAQVAAMGLSTIQANLLLQLSHYGSMIENWGGGGNFLGFTAYSESAESGWPYMQVTGQQHPVYTWMKGQQIGATSTGFHYNVTCSGGNPDTAQYRCNVDTLYGIPLSTGPGGTDLSGRSCATLPGCDVSGHMHIEDPCALSGYIPPGSLSVNTGQPTACAGLTIISLSGSGSGTVTSNPTGMNCDHVTACNMAMGLGKSVTLTAIPGIGSAFAGWSGGSCSGTGTCTVTFGSTPQNLTATFKSSTGTVLPPAKPQNLQFK